MFTASEFSITEATDLPIPNKANVGTPGFTVSYPKPTQLGEVEP